VPAQNGVRRHDRGDIGQQPAAQAMPELGEASPLGVIETQAPPCQLRLQHSILFPQKRNYILLLALQPTAEHRHHELKRKHRRSLRQQRDPSWDTTGSRPTEGRLGIDDPVGVEESIDERSPGRRLMQVRAVAGEVEFVTVVRVS
jgi:hypothetical protein